MLQAKYLSIGTSVPIDSYLMSDPCVQFTTIILSIYAGKLCTQHILQTFRILLFYGNFIGIIVYSIRRAFMRCVSEVSHHYCSKNATIFLLKMAETLVRTAMRGNTPQPSKCDCKAVIEECDIRNGGGDTGLSLRDTSGAAFVIFLCFLSKTLLIDTMTPL